MITPVAAEGYTGALGGLREGCSRRKRPRALLRMHYAQLQPGKVFGFPPYFHVEGTEMEWPIARGGRSAARSRPRARVPSGRRRSPCGGSRTGCRAGPSTGGRRRCHRSVSGATGTRRSACPAARVKSPTGRASRRSAGPRPGRHEHPAARVRPPSRWPAGPVRAPLPSGGLLPSSCPDVMPPGRSRSTRLGNKGVALTARPPGRRRQFARRTRSSSLGFTSRSRQVSRALHTRRPCSSLITISYVAVERPWCRGVATPVTRPERTPR